MKKTGARLYAVIGDPVRHSLSPVFQNAAFKALRIHAFYFSLRVRPAKLAKTIRVLRKAGISGFNVTLPLKTHVMKYLDRVDPLAFRIGAVNTVCCRRGKLIGFNTDAKGFRSSLWNDLRMRPTGKKIVLLGSGGVAQAVGHVLVHGRVKHLVIANRHKDKARKLARRLQKTSRRVQIEIVSLKSATLQEAVRGADLLINATRLGLRARDPLPVNTAWVGHRTRVLDLVYGPKSTRFVQVLRKRGIRAADGLGMLVDQGAESFRLWTGRRAPAAAMRRAIKMGDR